jgi:hypothetical protein
MGALIAVAIILIIVLAIAMWFESRNCRPQCDWSDVRPSARMAAIVPPSLAGNHVGDVRLSDRGGSRVHGGARPVVAP